MSWKLFSFGGPLLLAGAVALATPASAQAQHHGGGHGGGFHAGGFHGSGHGGGGHVGGVHAGGFHGGGFRGGHVGGFHHGGWGNRGWGHWSGGNWYPYYGSYSYPDYGGYGYYPSYYGGYDYSPSYYDDPAYYNGSSYDSNGLRAVTDDSGYRGSSGSATPSYSYGSLSSSSAPATDTGVRVTLTVPAGARVSFGGMPTTTTGTVREYQSPPLTPGRQYTYDIAATWNENGHEVTQAQQVEVTAGAHVNVTFPTPPVAQR